MSKKAFLSANEAAAHGVRLCRPDVVAAYPITPQTTLVEKLADFLADGEADFRYMMVESEHSAMAAALGASMMGARTFTASSSQGLLYMCEMLSYVSGARHPVVMVDANRATATPWNIYGDQRDVFAMRDSGWIMLFAENGQEALDMVIQAYKLAEDPEVMTPVMVNLDGFTLTHTYDLVEIPEQEEVDAFLPPFKTSNKLDLEDPKTLCQTVGPDFHMEGRYLQQQAFEKAKEKIAAYDREYGEMTGRSYGGMIEEYRCEDAELVLVTTGSVSGTTRIVVDCLREEGKKVGMIRVRSYRPFPKEYFDSIKDRFAAMGVIDRSLSFGLEGTLYSEVKAELYGGSAKLVNFIVGLGGRDIPKDLIAMMYDKLDRMQKNEAEEEVQFLGMRW
ncbi:pyruvate ferredoxin oxidoreductase [Anaerotignum lactatifermentans]|uniref:Pyruvate ferredoxin oxidoreductase n=1 Tax=Anaerotignum lactatifermentans TaxID=160404 RepID=A0ABS2GEQ6_9FIRM|nr:pyruvate ferredoxin oxidoreductase [Anaerotignum lactatifermentans]MBM6830448.1 pyruvate ferredoxin oxidoreductase [Anaerotignum lactatifermentans]MBM6878974.1 pyruvate ferredoxin oxidoreductase [Anaerotignum lactatifermentans]MBM6952020.1 pyruvate ferredoxin oxidoreductase [Anaerotignum lactatifermentans]